jgi:hypothetical protein
MTGADNPETVSFEVEAGWAALRYPSETARKRGLIAMLLPPFDPEQFARAVIAEENDRRFAAKLREFHPKSPARPGAREGPNDDHTD